MSFAKSDDFEQELARRIHRLVERSTRAQPRLGVRIVRWITDDSFLRGVLLTFLIIGGFVALGLAEASRHGG